ncbi:MAG: hypothetical protein BFD77_00550 [Pseudomonas sp. CO183]|nr:MAG: hypothetical protein BFD77_00550 [Pseudomonas sp. CO183]
MYNLIVKSSEWDEGHNGYWKSRVFETTQLNQPTLANRHRVNSRPDFAQLSTYPALFVEETSRLEHAQVGYVGRILEVTMGTGDSLSLDISFDRKIPPIPQSTLLALASQLGIYVPTRGLGEFDRTHWELKDIDLFKVLLRAVSESIRTPKVFDVAATPVVNPVMVSVMMPFAGFNEVYAAIQAAVAQVGMSCQRADSVLGNSPIIQDIANIIDQAAVVICDCSGQNANVFYEMGIAHALGKEVIIITQHNQLMPFDIGHLRHIRYWPNAEGRAQLIIDLAATLVAVIGR